MPTGDQKRSDVLESVQHRAEKIIYPHSGLDDKELNATFGVVPLINKGKLHIVFLARNCLDGSVPPSLNDYFNLKTSVHTFTRRCFNDIHLPKVNFEVAKISFFFTGVIEFNGLPRLEYFAKGYMNLRSSLQMAYWRQPFLCSSTRQTKKQLFSRN